MNFKKQYIVILVAALVLGFAGAFAGFKLAQPDSEKKDDDTVDMPVALNGGNMEDSEDMDKVNQAFNLIKENYLNEVEDEDLIEGAVKGMLDTLDDPYSSYMDADMMKDFDEEMESSFEGIGAEVSKVNGDITIVSPIKNSPAEEEGLRPNDQILKVGDESVEGLELQEAVDEIRGEKGSEVVIKIKRPGVSDPFDVTLKRDDIPVETVYSDIKK